MFGRTKAPKPPQPEIAQELRAFEDRLLGWTVEGAGACDLHSLLLRAADEIERAALRAAVPAGVQADAALVYDAIASIGEYVPHWRAKEIRAKARAAADRLVAALQRQDLALRFIAQEAKDGRVEVEQGVKNAPTFWLESIERRAVAALPGTNRKE